MNRRQMFALGAVAPIALAGLAQAEPKPQGVRYSCHKDDPGYEAYNRLKSRGYDLRVYLNGELVADGVFTIDTGEGTIQRYVRDENGDYVLDEARDRLKVETLRGDVRVEAYDWRKA